MHVLIAVSQQRLTYRFERPGLIAAEVIGENQIESCFRFGLVLVVPLRVVPGLASLHLFNC